jgi:hypothetical protein
MLYTFTISKSKRINIMGRIKDLILDTQEAGYDISKVSLEEMIQIRDHGAILDPVKDREAKLSEEDEAMLENAETEVHYQMMTTFGPRLHGYE